jgi:hypothetical protein
VIIHYFVVISAVFDAVDFPLLLIVYEEFPAFITLRLFCVSTEHAFRGSLIVMCCVYTHCVLENHIEIFLTRFLAARLNPEILGKQVEGF